MNDEEKKVHFLALIPHDMYADFLSCLSPYSVAMLDYFICDKKTFLGQVCHVFSVFNGRDKSFLDYISPHFVEKKAQEIANAKNIKLKKMHFEDAFREIFMALYSEGLFLHIEEC
jgi:hypothetical protein